MRYNIIPMALMKTGYKVMSLIDGETSFVANQFKVDFVYVTSTQRCVAQGVNGKGLAHHFV